MNFMTRREMAAALFVVAAVAAGNLISFLHKKVSFHRVFLKPAADYGKVNVNTADARILSDIPGIGVKLAERIIEFRRENGPFGSIEDIRTIKGLGKTKFEHIQGSITVD